MSKKASIPSQILEHYERPVTTRRGVERKGAAMPYMSVNGHMFGFLTETDTLALRLPIEEREAFLQKYKATLCERHETVMEEYVVVPDTLLGITSELETAFAASHAYAASLKPKPTRKSKPART